MTNERKLEIPVEEGRVSSDEQRTVTERLRRQPVMFLREPNL